MLIYTELFSNVSRLGLIHCGLGLEKIFGPRPRPHSFWPRPHAQLASLTSVDIIRRNHTCVLKHFINIINTGQEAALSPATNCSSHTIQN